MAVWFGIQVPAPPHPLPRTILEMEVQYKGFWFGYMGHTRLCYGESVLFSYDVLVVAVEHLHAWEQYSRAALFAVSSWSAFLDTVALMCDEWQMRT